MPTLESKFTFAANFEGHCRGVNMSACRRKSISVTLAKALWLRSTISQDRFRGDLLAQVVNETADLEAMENFKAYCSGRSKRDVTRVLGRRKL